MAPKPRVIYWFRTDLRLHDSPALKAALDLEPECLWPVWCWDPHYVFKARVGPNRWRFLLDCQQDVSDSITKLNKKSKLFVVREAPQTVLPKLWKAWKVSHLVFEKDVDGYGRDRDNQVMESAKKAGIKVLAINGRTLWDSDDLVKANGGKPTMSMNQVKSAGAKVGEIARPIEAPKSLPDPGETGINFDQEKPPSDFDVNAVFRKGVDESYFKVNGPKGDFAVPTMDEMKLQPATGPHRGGESRALKTLDTIIQDEDYTARFEKPKTAPTAFDPQSTTLLSPHMHFGSISCREFYWRVRDVQERNKKIASSEPANLTGQILFRDMYFGAQAALGYKFGQTVGNAYVRFVPWHLRSSIDGETGLKKLDGSYLKDSNEAEIWLKRWRTGTTGFPWIDAVMRQLRHDGWVHHLARHAVACFLTRGGCYIDWERGAETFEEFLIDHETACNVGNWQWPSCTAFFAQYYRCYSPISFPQKTDKKGDYVRRFVPELKNYPAKYIYEPWKCPIVDQKKAGCLIKGNGSETKIDGQQVYPKPMFDFNERRDICIQGMKEAYNVGLYGNNKKVLDGTWRGLFNDAGEGPTEGRSQDDAAEEEEATAWDHDADDEHYHMGDESQQDENSEDTEMADDNGSESGRRRKKSQGQKVRPDAKRKRQANQGTMDKHVVKSSRKTRSGS